MKKDIALLFCLFLMFALFVPAAALDGAAALEPDSEIPIPNGIAFEIHDSCWEHDWFEQYHAREDGWYIVMCFVANLNGGDARHFDRAYIDIFDANGVFQKELALNNSDTGLAARLTDTAVEIYLTNYCLSYDLATEKVSCHDIPNNYVKDSGLYEQLRKSEKQIGEWTYKSSGLPGMYRTLTREKDGCTQTVLKLKGSSLDFPAILPYVLCSLAVIVVFLGAIWYIAKKKRKTKE